MALSACWLQWLLWLAAGQPLRRGLGWLACLFVEANGAAWRSYLSAVNYDRCSV